MTDAHAGASEVMMSSVIDIQSIVIYTRTLVRNDPVGPAVLVSDLPSPIRNGGHLSRKPHSDKNPERHNTGYLHIYRVVWNAVTMRMEGRVEFLDRTHPNHIIVF